MSHFMLAVHSSPDAPTQPDPTPEQQQAWFERIVALETELQESGAWVFSGAMTDPDRASVVRTGDDAPIVSDGPFAESKEHLAGFYVIEVDDLDEAMAWAARVTACVGRPIEVRPFAATGAVADNAPPGMG